MVRNRVIDRDLGFDKIVKEFRLAGRGLSIGVQGKEAAADHGGISTAAVASIHEFGNATQSIPERSYLRSTLDRNRRKYRKKIRKAASDVIGGKDIDTSLQKIGDGVVDDIVETLNSGIAPPLAPSTLQKRAAEGIPGDTPLVATGQLADSITAVVK